MNYLAHAYLSFNNNELLVGNLISDFVKGKKKFGYPPGIQNGITLHRFIDEFTDQHPATREAKEVFRPAYRLYAGAFVDVVYDHFLAIDSNEFSETSLNEFSQNVYAAVDVFSHHLPDRFAAMFPYMKTQNWLFHYRSARGIEKSFGGVVRRAAYITESKTAFELFEKNYDLLSSCYTAFFSDVKASAYEKHIELTR